MFWLKISLLVGTKIAVDVLRFRYKHLVLHPQTLACQKYLDFVSADMV